MAKRLRLYKASDEKRELDIVLANGFTKEEYRTPWRRDYARLVHCPSFRRLNGKTQLFPGSESDFFRNRLTHSIEVAQIAKSIAIRLNHLVPKGAKYRQFRIEPDIVEFAGLAHDLGHPPFGHLGEEALDKLMVNFGGFEGNAQTLRILSRLEKRHFIQLSNPKDDSRCGIDVDNQDRRIGLNITYRNLASIIKYDNEIPDTKLKRDELFQRGKIRSAERPVKGYYETESELVRRIKRSVIGADEGITLKTIECQIMDIADDIAYSTYDLEDAFKAGFTTPLKLLAARDSVLKDVAERSSRGLGRNVEAQAVVNVFYDLFDDLLTSANQLDIGDMPMDKLLEVTTKYLPKMLLRKASWASEVLARDGYDRTGFTSRLVGQFIRAVDWDTIDEAHPALSTIKMAPSWREKLEILKQMNFVSQIESPRLKIVEIRGKDIVNKIFEVLTVEEGAKLLPKDCYEVYMRFETEKMKKRAVCDFIAGMTDRYAIEFYGRLTSESPETIFKPH